MGEGRNGRSKVQIPEPTGARAPSGSHALQPAHPWVGVGLTGHWKPALTTVGAEIFMRWPGGCKSINASQLEFQITLSDFTQRFIRTAGG